MLKDSGALGILRSFAKLLGDLVKNRLKRLVEHVYLAGPSPTN